MSLDVDLMAKKYISVFEYNITHNLGEMAKKVGIYKHLWHPEELHITTAKYLIKPLTKGLIKLKKSPKKYKKYNPKNGWGNYYTLVNFIEKYLSACIKNPVADIETNT